MVLEHLHLPVTHVCSKTIVLEQIQHIFRTFYSESVLEIV